MPIYMDFHDLTEVTVEGSQKAHSRDVSVQEKYKVRYLQYWINEQEGKAYCLIEGPNKKACKATHKEANGVEACNLVEVKGGMYDLFLGDHQKIDQGLVRHFDGEVDNGYRFIMSLELMRPMALSTQKKVSKKTVDQLKLECIGIVEKYDGRDIHQPEQDTVVGIFRTPEAALRCSIDIRLHLLNSMSKTKFKSYNFKMGLCSGQPVTKNRGFFEEALNLAEILSNISVVSEITTSRNFSQIAHLNEQVAQNNGFRILEAQDLAFLTSLYGFIGNNLEKETLSVDLLGPELSVSRAQLYRKIRSLTGISPNHFIRNQRLDKALYLLKEGNSTMSKIALDVGFNNPSYFSKCFQNRFGISPSKIK